MDLSGFQKAELVLRLKPIVQEKAREKQATSTGGSTPQLSQKSDEAVPIRTDEELAKLAGVSHDTIYKAEIIKNEGTEEQIQHKKRPAGAGGLIFDIFHYVTGLAF